MLSLPQFSLLIALSALFVIAALRVWRWHTAPKVTCQWERDPQAATDLSAWVCQTCGEQAFSGDGEQPAECKKMLRAQWP